MGLALGKARTHDIALDLAVELANESRLGFAVGVVAREIIGEEFAVLEDGLDGFAEKSRVGANRADDGAILRVIGTDDALNFLGGGR